MTYIPKVGDIVTLVDPAKIEDPAKQKRYIRYLAGVSGFVPGYSSYVVGINEQDQLADIYTNIGYLTIYFWELEEYYIPNFDEAGAL